MRQPIRMCGRHERLVGYFSGLNSNRRRPIRILLRSSFRFHIINLIGFVTIILVLFGLPALAESQSKADLTEEQNVLAIFPGLDFNKECQLKSNLTSKSGGLSNETIATCAVGDQHKDYSIVKTTECTYEFNILIYKRNMLEKKVTGTLHFLGVHLNGSILTNKPTLYCTTTFDEKGTLLVEPWCNSTWGVPEVEPGSSERLQRSFANYRSKYCKY